jgi:hypothetical protein
MKLKLLFLLTFCCLKSFSVDNYKKGDILYVLLKEGLTLYDKPDLKSKVKKELSYKDEVVVLDDKQKKVPFTIHEIEPILSEDPNIDAFPGFTISGFWVKIITHDDKISGYVYDAYLTTMKNGFDLTREYFNKAYILDRSVVVPPKKADDYLFANSYYYMNGAYILENGSDYDGHARYFIPNISLQEAYMLIKSPGLFELEIKNGKNTTKIEGNKYSLVFSSKMEKRSLDVKVGKISGVEVVFETWVKH